MQKSNLQPDLETLIMSAYPYVGNGTHFVNKGVNTLLYVACQCKDDFDSLPDDIKNKIVPLKEFKDELQRILACRTRWRIMQAKSLINESKV